MTELSGDDYYLISHLVRGSSGLDLGKGKEYLVVSRLEPLLPGLQLASLAELFARLRAQPVDTELVRKVSEALATHESLFFRDGLPFDYLVREMLPRLARARDPGAELRIWSSACSFGQEPYSILFSLEENPGCTEGRPCSLVATDFSAYAVSRAQAGLYSNFEVQRGLTPSQLTRFFEPVGSEWRVREAIRQRVRFLELNFLDSFLPIGTVDIIFCRNVLIYFEQGLKKEVLVRMRAILAPDGYLVLGSTESILGVTEDFEQVSDSPCAIFRPAPR
jgi:chemotaxis protein methyltransferase CheR